MVVDSCPSVDDELTTTGLTASEVAQRVASGQTNDVPARAARSVQEIIRANIFTRINAILGVLLLIVLSTGSLINGMFGLLIVANSGIGIIQELRAKRTLDRLAIVGQTKPVVRRAGVSTAIAPDGIVLDDIIELGSGDQIVVDGVIIETAGLEVDESLLTGEADALPKNIGDQVLSGSFVVSGSGAYRALKVGKDAYAAQLAEEASKFTLVNSELRTGIDKILKFITYLLIPAGLLIIYTQLFSTHQSFQKSVLGMVGALVPMVPEGLVLMTSIAFAVGVVRLGRRQCLVQELPAIEGLARVDVVCADKTGTLTENGMKLSELRFLGDDSENLLSNKEIEQVLAALAADDPRPNASVQAIAEAYPKKPEWTQTGVAPFSSAKKWSGISYENNGNWIIGAPDVLLDSASADARTAEEIGAHGLRVLLLASSDCNVEEHNAAADVTPVALVVLEQRVRADAQETLDYFASQGVGVKVISGDNAVS
ncbi:MAG: HAD-IC family P-type ATPase, partial [Mycobacteriaceae bacterium]